MGSSPAKPDIFDIIQKIPAPGTLLWGFARALLVMGICIFLWRHAGLEKPVGIILQNTSQWVADRLIDPVEIMSMQPSPQNPQTLVPTKSLATVTIHAAAQSHQNFALLLPVILLAAFPLKRFATTLPQMLFGIFFMTVFAVLLHVVQSYILFNYYLEHGIGTLDIMKERLILLPVNYIILPALALFLSGMTVSGFGRLFSQSPNKSPAKISTENKKERPSTQPNTGRNEPCPCGSGKKFKKCCGKSAN